MKETTMKADDSKKKLLKKTRNDILNKEGAKYQIPSLSSRQSHRLQTEQVSTLKT